MVTMKNKPSVCMLIPEHFSSQMGGAEYQAKLLVDALCKTNKYEITYLCHSSDKTFKPDGYQIRRIDDNRYLNTVFAFRMAPKIYSELQRLKPAIIYQNVAGVHTGVAAFYAKKFGARLIWHIASDDDVNPQWKENIKKRFFSIPDRLFIQYALRNTHLIAAQTKYQADVLYNKYGIRCSTFIPIGHPYPEDELKKSDLVSVLWVANLKPLKRPELFVQLAERFSDRKDVHFTMIGRVGWGNWFKEILSKISKLPNIDYVGELPQYEVNQYLNKSHILVNTSRYEGFSNTFVQAWMRKVPVVSLSVDPDDILTENKIGFKSKTTEQLNVDLTKLINNEHLRKEMGNRAQKYAFENHSLEKMTNSAINLFNNLI